eukprot:jgi/Tetstr1/438462/TSEL_027017.t1
MTCQSEPGEGCDASEPPNNFTPGGQRRPGQRWLARFEELKAYQAEHGHCRVPQSQAGLGIWVARMRMLARDSGKLTAEQVALLDGIGFEREPSGSKRRSDAAWYAMLSRLQAYAALHGHSWVPCKYEPDQRLANWAAKQRGRRRNGTLPAERGWVLDEVGFPWGHGCGASAQERADAAWYPMLKRLQAYYAAQHQHCQLRENFTPDQQLERWAAAQRHLRRRGVLPMERAWVLDEVGFEQSSRPRKRRPASDAARVIPRVRHRSYAALPRQRAAPLPWGPAPPEEGQPTP